MTSDRRAREDLRTTIDSVNDDAQKLAAVEEEKRRLDPHDPRIAELSREARVLASRAERGAAAESEIARELQRPGRRQPD